MAFLSDIKDIIVTFGLDPNIQVEQGIKCFLDPRVYSSLALGHEDDKRGKTLALGHEDDKRGKTLTLEVDDDKREVKPEHDHKIRGVIW